MNNDSNIVYSVHDITLAFEDGTLRSHLILKTDMSIEEML